MDFKSLINPHENHKFAEGGFKKTVDVYEDIVNSKTGKLETKKTKEENFYEKIQEMKESQTLENILRRYNIDLNENHITEIYDEIVDMTEMPEDLIETYAMTKKLENMFNETTADIKNHFGDFASFLKSFQNGNLKSEIQSLSRKTQKTVQQTQQTQAAQQVEKENQPVEGEVKRGIIYGR